MGSQLPNESLPELVRLLAADAKELVRAEVSLAKVEFNDALRALLLVIAGCTAAAVVALLSLCMFVAAAVLAAGGSAAVALAAAGGWGSLMVTAAAWVGMRLMSRSQPTDALEPSASAAAAAPTTSSTTPREVL